jgi:predicted metal-dependent peptidase
MMVTHPPRPYVQNPVESSLVLEYLQAARMYLVAPKQRPYLAVAAFKLEFIPTNTIPTAAVDSSWRCYYNEEFILNTATDKSLGGVPAIAAVIEHELWHLLRRHPERADNSGVVSHVQGRLWNWAADIEIHSDAALADAIRGTGVEPLTPEYFGFPPHKVVEVYYSKLLEHIINQGSDEGGEYVEVGAQPPQGAAEPGGPSGHSGQSRAGDSEGSEGSGESDREEVTIKAYVDPDQPQVGAGDCGSCANGQQASWEKEPSGRVQEHEAEQVRTQVAQSIEEWAKEAGSGMGTQHSSGIVEWAKNLLHPRVPWQQVLRSAIRSSVAWVSGQTEYSKRRFSRRQSAMPHVILPGMVHPTPEIAIVIDASASMFSEGERATLFEEAMAEVGGILKKFGSTIGITVYSVDSAVGWSSRIYKASQLRGIGGGGTDMGIGIKAAASARPKPQIIIVITDGETPWPATAPHGIKTVIAIVGNNDHVIRYGSPPPPWAWKVIWVDE